MDYSSKSLLIVEDEALIAMDLEYAAEEHGYGAVHWANTIALARSKIASETIDCGVFDVTLPDGPSLGLARECLDRGIPIVFHTGNSEAREMSAGYERACFVGKPCPAVTVIDALEQFAI